MDKKQCLKEFQLMPGVGKSVANDLWNMGFRKIEDLKDLNPETLYADFETLMGCKIDRCMLYTFRCCVYYASNTAYDPELLKWWNWKDSNKHKQKR